MLLENIKAYSALAPVADAFAGTVVSDSVNMKNYNRVTFLIIKGVGLTGVSTVTVEKATNNAGGSAEAIPFRYARVDANGDVNASGAQNASASGFSTTAGSDEMYVIEVRAEDLLGTTSKPFVRVKLAETVDSPVTGSIIALLHEPKHVGRTYLSA